MSEAQPIMRASDYAAAIEDQVKLVRYYRSLQADHESHERHAAELRMRGTELVAQADRIEAELLEAEELEERAVAEIRRLREGQSMLKVQTDVRVINKLADQLADLAPDALANLIAQLEAQQTAKKGGAK